MIEPTFTFLCDAAVESDGKLTAVGVGIDTLGSGQVPFQHKRLCLVIGFHYEAEDAGERGLRLQVVEADGRDLVPRQETPISFPMPNEPKATARFVTEHNGLQFNNWGTHEFRIFLDEELVAAVPLNVVQTTPLEDPPAIDRSSL